MSCVSAVNIFASVEPQQNVAKCFFHTKMLVNSTPCCVKLAQRTAYSCCRLAILQLLGKMFLVEFHVGDTCIVLHIV